MAEGIGALKAAVKLVAHAVKDSVALIAAGQGNGSTLKAILAYQNLLPDLMDLVPQIGDLPKQAVDIDANELLLLTQELVVDLGLPEGHVAHVISAALALLNHLVHDVAPVVGKVWPAIEHLIDLLRGEAAK